MRSRCALAAKSVARPRHLLSVEGLPAARFSSRPRGTRCRKPGEIAEKLKRPAAETAWASTKPRLHLFVRHARRSRGIVRQGDEVDMLERAGHLQPQASPQALNVHVLGTLTQLNAARLILQIRPHVAGVLAHCLPERPSASTPMATYPREAHAARSRARGHEGRAFALERGDGLFPRRRDRRLGILPFARRQRR